MRIACRVQVRITELSKQKSKPFEVPIYQAGYYTNNKLFKVEHRLAIVRVSVYTHSEGTTFEDKEVLKSSDWYVKHDRNTIRMLSFADTMFAYNESNDTIYIERDFDEV